MPQEIPEIERSIREYEEVITSFERASERLRARRKVAHDGTAVGIDRLLELNERTLKSLRNVLDSARSQLAQARTTGRDETEQRDQTCGDVGRRRDSPSHIRRT